MKFHILDCVLPLKGQAAAEHALAIASHAMHPDDAAALARSLREVARARITQTETATTEQGRETSWASSLASAAKGVARAISTSADLEKVETSQGPLYHAEAPRGSGEPSATQVQRGQRPIQVSKHARLFQVIPGPRCSP